MTPLLPAPRIRGNHKVTRTPAVIHLPAWCPPGLGGAVYPDKPIIITTAHGSIQVDGYADIGWVLRVMMQAPVTLIEPIAEDVREIA